MAGKEANSSSILTFSPGDSLKEEKKFSLIVLGGKFEEATYLAKFGTPAHVYNNRFD